MRLLTLDLVENYARYMYQMHEHSTAKRYVWELKKAVKFLTANFKGAPPIAAIGKEHLLAFLMDGAVKSDAPRRTSWNNRLRPLRSFWNYLCEAELTDENPAQRIKPAKVRSDRRMPLAFAEFLALVDVVETSSPHYRARNKAMVMVLFFSGFRVSEVTRLKLTNIDWSNSAFVNVRVKGGKHIDVPFPKIVGEALKACLAEREQFSPASAEQACFLSDRGTQISVRQFEDFISRCGKLAGILRPVSPHVVRHTSATELARGGLSLFGLQNFLGHESILATQRYVHLTDEVRYAVDGLDERFTALLAERERLKRQTNEALSTPKKDPP